MKKNSKIRMLLNILAGFVLIGAIIYGTFLFTKTYNSNLDDFSKNTSEKNTTEDKKGAENKKENEKKENNKASILFVGDLMFDRSIRQFAKSKGNDFIFENIHDYLRSADAVVANLEGPITSSSSVSVGTQPGQGGHFKFTFDSALAETLFKQNIKLVNLGNNHILNFGKDGLIQTKEHLTKAKIDFFGDAGEKFYETHEEIVNGITFVFINYNQFALGSLERTTKEIETSKNQDKIVVVYTHWGVEYAKTASDEIKKTAHIFVDSGADLVIGTHPHVIQDNEIYNGKMIYYSLGNFIFDQYFSPETVEGLTVMATCNSEKECSFTEKKIKMKTNGQTEMNAL